MNQADAITREDGIEECGLRRFSSPALMFMNGRGDYLLNLPTLRAMSALFNGAFTFVTKPGVKSLFYQDIAVSRLVEVECSIGPTGPEFDADAVAECLGDCDLFLSLNPWRTASLDRLVGQMQGVPAIGFSSGFSHALPLNFAKHTVDLGFDLVRCLSSALRVESFAAPPRFDRRHESLAQLLRSTLPPGARLVVVHGDTKPEKKWDEAGFAKVISWLIEGDSHCFVVDLGLHPAAGRLLADTPQLISCCELVLPAAFALTGLADLFVGVDSCFLHAADLYRVPGVGLFGPTDPAEFGFRFGPHRHVAAPTMAEIDPDEVIRAIELLGISPRSQH